jgi:hypothetical protein
MSPYVRTTWVDNTTLVDASKMNNIETELVMLDARVPAVVNGQWLKGVGGAVVWAPITADDIVGSPMVPGGVAGQKWRLTGGSTVVTTDVNGGATVAWPMGAVISVQAVVVCGGQGWGTPDVMVNIDDAVPPSTTGFSIRARTNAGAGAFVNGNVRFQWIAVVAQ